MIVENVSTVVFTSALRSQRRHIEKEPRETCTVLSQSGTKDAEILSERGVICDGYP